MHGGKPVVFAANDGFACRVLYPGCAEWERRSAKIKSGRACSSRRLDARVLLIDGADGLPLIWELEPASAVRASLPAH